ncbi:MAG: precorrin-3B C(17)-methyltransferase [Pseudomonadota bacterium]
MIRHDQEPAIVVLSPASLPVAEEIRALTGGKIHGLSTRVKTADYKFDLASTYVPDLFSQGKMIVGVMASGALVRLLASHIGPKQSDPVVISVADDGSSVVPILGGHSGGNQIARVIADHLGGHAAITTAGDVRFGVALDDPPVGWKLANPDQAKGVMASLLGGAEVMIDGDLAQQADWLRASELPIAETAPIRLTFSSTRVDADPLQLVYHAQNLVVGVGCERGCDPDHAVELVERTLEENGLFKGSVRAVVSLDLKADEPAIHAVAKKLDVEARFFDAETLEAETPRLQNPSDIVFAEVGCHGVSEGAALAAVGPDGALVVPKVKTSKATVAIARREAGLTTSTGRSRGRLFVVGIGPGGEGWRSPEVSQMVLASTDLIGYSLYLDLLGRLCEGRVRHDFDLGKEEDRVRHAMELAGQGKDVALVCSGDAGIYAMATLVFELLADGGLSDAAKRIAIEVSPGISALQGAAARAGAPLGHDFCTISLSDLLTPWDMIQKRVQGAAQADFVIAFYNPVSRRRRTQLAYARDVLLQHRPGDTPVILATNLGREGEHVHIVPLAELNIDDVDMLTVVIVGSSETRTVTAGDGRNWVYTPRGYAAKDGTKIGSQA